MARYHGRTGLVYLSTTGTGNAASVVLSSWTLNMATDKAEVTSFGDSNKQYVQGFRDVSGELSGFWDDTSDTLYDGSGSTDGVKMYLYPSSNALTKYWYGPAWLDFKVETNVGGGVSVGGSFAANGNWGQY